MQVKYHEMETKIERFLVEQIFLLWNGHSDARPRDPAAAAGEAPRTRGPGVPDSKMVERIKKVKNVLRRTEKTSFCLQMVYIHTVNSSLVQ